MSQKSAEVIVIYAFGAHFMKEVSHSQLSAATKTLLPVNERKILHGAEKSRFVKSLAAQFIIKKIVSVKCGAMIQNLVREDVTKQGTF